LQSYGSQSHTHSLSLPHSQAQLQLQAYAPVQLQASQVQTQLFGQLEQFPQVIFGCGPEQFDPVKQLQWLLQAQLQFKSL
jgi:hypothetical protein